MTKGINECLNGKILKALTAFNALGALEPQHDGDMSIGVSIYPLKAKENGELFVPTGTQSEPAGLASSSADVVLVHINHGQHILFYTWTVDEFKELIKKSRSTKPTLDEEFETRGYLVDLKEIVMIS